AGAVADNRMRDPVLAELPCSQARALATWTRLIYPDMQRNTGFMRSVDRRQGSSPVHCRQPAGIAMGQYIQPTFFSCYQLLYNFKPMLADGLILLHIFFANLCSFFPCVKNAFLCGNSTQMILNPTDRPLQVDRCGTACNKHLACMGEVGIAVILNHRKGDTIGSSSPDQWGSPHLHALDCLLHAVHAIYLYNFEPV